MDKNFLSKVSFPKFPSALLLNQLFVWSIGMCLILSQAWYLDHGLLTTARTSVKTSIAVCLAVLYILTSFLVLCTPNAGQILLLEMVYPTINKSTRQQSNPWSKKLTQIGTRSFESAWQDCCLFTESQKGEQAVT